MFNRFVFNFRIEIYALKIKNFKNMYIYIGVKKMIGRLSQVSARKIKLERSRSSFYLIFR